jgi:hypothetical protein
MKVLVKLYPLLIIVVFIASCFLSGKIAFPIIENNRTYSVNNSPYPASWMKIVVFTENNAEEVSSDDLEVYKKEHSDYSFLLKKDKEDFYKAKLLESVRANNYQNTPKLIVEQIDDKTQLIEFRSLGDDSDHFTKYRATDKEVQILSFTRIDRGAACEVFIISIFSGLICCGIFKFIFNRYIKPKAVEA